MADHRINDVNGFDPKLDRILKAPSFDDPAFTREGQWRELVSRMWEQLAEDQRDEVYFGFMGTYPDAEE